MAEDKKPPPPRSSAPTPKPPPKRPAPDAIKKVHGGLTGGSRKKY
jgi:hypothetical protein